MKCRARAILNGRTVCTKYKVQIPRIYCKQYRIVGRNNRRVCAKTAVYYKKKNSKLRCVRRTRVIKVRSAQSVYMGENQRRFRPKNRLVIARLANKKIGCTDYKVVRVAQRRGRKLQQVNQVSAPRIRFWVSPKAKKSNRSILVRKRINLRRVRVNSGKKSDNQSSGTRRPVQRYILVRKRFNFRRVRVNNGKESRDQNLRINKPAQRYILVRKNQKYRRAERQIKPDGNNTVISANRHRITIRTPKITLVKKPINSRIVPIKQRSRKIGTGPVVIMAASQKPSTRQTISVGADAGLRRIEKVRIESPL